MAALGLSALAETFVAIDAATFPDDNFRAYVSEEFDADGDGRLSEAERDEVNKISVSWYDIASLEGLAHFRNLKKLECNWCQLKTLDVRQNASLRILRC